MHQFRGRGCPTHQLGSTRATNPSVMQHPPETHRSPAATWTAGDRSLPGNGSALDVDELLEHRVRRGDHSRAGLEAALGERSEEHTSELQSLMRSSYAVFCLK